MSEQPGGWREHMHMDVASRHRKAQKLVRMLGSQIELRGAKVLEIGTGTGVISAELATAVGLEGMVTSIDTLDTRVVSTDYEFQLTSGVELQFPDRAFDVIVSNHVIEHVGGRQDQAVHLGEIARVLHPQGLAYLATPSRWALVEPHFKVPVLSWPPRPLRSPLVRMLRRGQRYDVDPFGPAELRRAIRAAGLQAEDGSLLAVEHTLHESGGLMNRVLSLVPRWVWRALTPLMPTIVVFLRSAEKPSHPRG